MRIVVLSALLVLGASAGAGAQSAPTIHANIIIPNPAPAAPIADWTMTDGRTLMTIEGDGVMLRGWKYAGKDTSAPAVVFFNGNGATIDGADPFYRQIAAQGPTVVAFDYRGYGFSTGVPDVAAFQRDGVRIFDVLSGVSKAQRVVVYGFSLGTAVAAYVAAQRPVAGLILAAPFSSARDEFPNFARASGMPPEMIASVVIAPDAIAAFDEVGFVAQSKAPLLILHGVADEQVPIELGRKVLAASAAPQKRMVELPGTDHNGAPRAPAAIEAVRAFAASLHP